MKKLGNRIKTYYSKASKYVVKEIIPATKRGLLELRNMALESVEYVFDHSSQIWLGIKIIGGLILLAAAPAILLGLFLIKFFFFGSSNSRCPKCESTNLNQVKPSRWSKYMAAGLAPWGSPPKTLIVCRDCGFSWDSR